LLALLLVVCAAAGGWADDDASDVRARLGLSGSLTLDYFSSSHAINDRRHFGGVNLVLKQRLHVADGVRWVAEARVLAEQIGHDDPNEAGGSVRDLRDVEEVVSELREGYGELTLGRWEVRAGKQIIAWGRADELNPTDAITPKDYLLLLPEGQSAYRYGVTALKADYFLTPSVRAIGVWVPVFSPSRIPLDVPDGVRLHERVPAIRIEDGSVGAKLDRSGGKLDASLSYYYGFNLLPEVRVESVALDAATDRPFADVALVHPRRHMIGADFATALDRFGYRGEIAYVHTGNAHGRSVDEVTPHLSYVLGIERSFSESVSVIVQYVGRYVVHRVDPARALADPDVLGGRVRFLAARETFVINQQLDTVQNGWSARIAKRWWNDTLEAEVLSLHYVERNDFFVRPKIAYDVADNWRATVGGEIFHGPKHSFFGRIEKNTGAFVELRYSF
jgi:hypothetical protein